MIPMAATEDEHTDVDESHAFAFQRVLQDWIGRTHRMRERATDRVAPLNPCVSPLTGVC
jgi:hypothetical protein